MGRLITEVWDYRLSTAQPFLYRGGMPGQETGTWVVVVMSQDDNNEILEAHDTGVKVVDGDLHDGEGIDACYKFLRSVRDKYSREGIEDLKPLVAEIRKAQAMQQEANEAYDAKLRELKEAAQ